VVAQSCLGGVQKTAGEILLVGVVGLYSLSLLVSAVQEASCHDSRASGSDDDPELENGAAKVIVPPEIYGTQTRAKSPKKSFRDRENLPTPRRTARRVTRSSWSSPQKQFGQRVAFEDVSFNVHRGEVFGFLGPNGAGKTSTVRTLSTLVSPTSGTAQVAGIPLNADRDVEIRHRIAVMTEVLSVLTFERHGESRFLRRSLRLPRRATTNRSSMEPSISRHERVISAAVCPKVFVSVWDWLERYSNDPEIIFLDEPTAGLDPVASLEVHDLIIDLRDKGVTCF